MIAGRRAALAALLLLVSLRATGVQTTLPPEEAPVAGSCADDAQALAAEADASFAEAGPSPPPAVIERARRLYRRARVLAPSAALSLRAADLACAAGDEEECGDLLSEADEVNAALLSPAERLLLARRAEARRQWREAISHYTSLRATALDSAWIDSKIRRLEVESEAEAIRVPAAVPPLPEARLALADARRAIAIGELAGAREKLALALKLSPGYVEASLALAALETRAGRAPEAIRAYRAALSSDPGRFEALVGLANVLWDEPDRAAKQESLALTDRAIAARPQATPLLKVSALRWAEWGDAASALTRLDAYRRRAGQPERQATDDLREALARRVDDVLSGRAGSAGEPEDAPELSSPAIAEWKVAQAYFRRGDPASLDSALEHLRETERLDPAFARAPELVGTIHEQRGEFAPARAAYERAILADPSRAATYERLALLIARQPASAAEAEETWRRAEQAGSSEALFHLAAAALRAGRRDEALSLYRRYLVESPAGVHTDEVSRAIEGLELRRRTILSAALAVGLLLLVVGGVLVYRRAAGRTFEEWLRSEPGRARDARPIVGRLRHEVLKHGGLLLEDAANRLSEQDRDVQRGTAELLVSRLYGANREGLMPQAFQTLADLESLAREDGVRLNLSHRDPLFSPIFRAATVLSTLPPGLSWLAEGPEAVPDRIMRRVIERLNRAAELLRSTSGPEMSRLLDEVSSTATSSSELQQLLDHVCTEKGLGPPPDLEWRGPEVAEITVRVDRGDWETIWRNLFANALDAAAPLPVTELRLGVFAGLARDPITGTPVARFVLADNVPRPLTAEMIRGRAADRGWGVVADLVRKHEGTADVVAAPASGYCKGIVLEVPALEGGIAE